VRSLPHRVAGGGDLLATKPLRPRAAFRCASLSMTEKNASECAVPREAASALSIRKSDRPGVALLVSVVPCNVFSSASGRHVILESCDSISPVIAFVADSLEVLERACPLCGGRYCKRLFRIVW
jgi:hypothetical protein